MWKCQSYFSIDFTIFSNYIYEGLFLNGSWVNRDYLKSNILSIKACVNDFEHQKYFNIKVSSLRFLYFKQIKVLGGINTY